MIARPASPAIRWPLAGRDLFIRKAAVRFFGGLLAGMLFCTASHAGSFQVNPLRVELSALEKSAVIRVQNTGESPVTIQSQVLTWSQQDGKDQLAPTREVLVSPPIFNLNPGSTQIVRVGLLRQADDVRELSYRLQMEEIPPPRTADFKGLQVALRIGMPVFVNPSKTAAQDLRFSVGKPVNGNLDLMITNHGNAHAQLYGLTLHTKEGQAIAAHDNPFYILPGQQRSISLKANDLLRADGDGLLVKGRTRTGSLESNADYIAP